MTTEQAKLNQLICKLHVQQLAIYQILRQLVSKDQSFGREFCHALRADVGELIQDNADQPFAGLDEAITLELAGLLEAAGEPPKV